MPSGGGARYAHLGGQLWESGGDRSRYLCSVDRRLWVENGTEYPVLSAEKHCMSGREDGSRLSLKWGRFVAPRQVANS